MSIDASIANNGTGQVTLVKAGPGFLKLRNHNSHSGGTFILQGRIQERYGRTKEQAKQEVDNWLQSN